MRRSTLATELITTIGEAVSGEVEPIATVATVAASEAAAARRRIALAVAPLPITPAAVFTGAAGVYVSATGPFTPTSGDLDVRVLLRMADWSTTPASGTVMTLASRGNNTGANQWKFEISETGQLVFRWSVDGSATFQTRGSLATLAQVPANATMWVRVAFDTDDGSDACVIHFFTSGNGVDWQPLGGQVAVAGGATAIFASSDPLRIGAFGAAGLVPLTARVFDAQVRDGINGAPMAHWRAGEATYADPQGNVWTMTGSLTIEKPPTTALVSLPGRLRNEWLYNAASYAANLCEWNGYQFAAWWGADGFARIGKRTIGSKTWEVFSLENVTGAGHMKSAVAADGHNVLAIIADADGFLHVCGNMHGDWMRYTRSTAAGVITEWEAPGIIRGTGNLSGTDEGNVTYPRLLTNPVTGELFFFYRNGASGSGDIYLNKYNTATKAWSRVGKILDGLATNESAYENTPVFGEDGTLHLSFTWAANGSGFNDRKDVCYMRSTDGGVTWRTIANAALSLPVTHTTAPVILPASTGDGLLNQSGMCVDASGRPHIALFYAPDGNRNIYHLWWNGSAWQLERVTDLTQTGLTWTGLSRPAIIHYRGRILIIWRHQYEGRRGKVWATDVSTPGQNRDTVLAEADLREWEPAPDMGAVRRGSLNLLLTRANGQVPAAIPGYGEANWMRQTAAVLTVDLSRYDERMVLSLVKDKPTDP